MYTKYYVYILQPRINSLQLFSHYTPSNSIKFIIIEINPNQNYVGFRLEIFAKQCNTRKMMLKWYFNTDLMHYDLDSKGTKLYALLSIKNVTKVMCICLMYIIIYLFFVLWRMLHVNGKSYTCLLYNVSKFNSRSLTKNVDSFLYKVR